MPNPFCLGGVTVAAMALLVPQAVRGDAPATLQTITVQGIRNPQAFDLKKGYDLQRRFDSVPRKERDKTRLAFVVTGKKTPVDLETLRLEVEVVSERSADTDYLPVDILPHAEIVLPDIALDPAAQSRIVANVPKGSVSIVYKVNIVPADTATSVRYLREAVSQARAGWKRTYGRLAALAVPEFSCAAFAFSSPQAVTVMVDGRAVWSSPASTNVQVPLEINGVPDTATLHWDQAALVRIGGCRLKRPA